MKHILECVICHHNVNFLYFECVFLSALEQIVSDLFAAGSDTVTNTLKWAVNYMVTCPEKMRLCQEQIDKVVPSDRLVSLEDKEK